MAGCRGGGVTCTSQAVPEGGGVGGADRGGGEPEAHPWVDWWAGWSFLGSVVRSFAEGLAREE